MVPSYEWRDFVEISLFAFLFYRLSCWLNTDPNKKFIFSFLGYCSFFALTYILKLSTICSFMIMYTPLIMIFFIIFHHKSLQKNFVAPVQKTVLTNNTTWIDTILSTCLYLLNNHIEITVLIENTHVLDSFLETECHLCTPISPLLLRMLTTNAFFNKTDMIWISRQGIIKGINTTWKDADLEQDFNITTHTDGILLKTDITLRSFSLRIQGHLFTKLSAEHAALLLKQHLYSHQTPLPQGDICETQYNKELSQ